MLIWNDFSYTIDKRTSQKTYWRCSDRCGARVVKEGGELTLTLPHVNHAPNQGKIAALKAIHVVKERAHTSQEMTGGLLDEALKEFPQEHSLSLPNRKLISRIVARIRGTQVSDVIPLDSRRMEMGRGVKVLAESEIELSISQVYAILQMRQDSTPAIPLRPLGGLVFLYYNPGKEEDWKADGYRWKNSGSKVVPSRCPSLLKTYYQLYVRADHVPVVTRCFRKVSYHLLEDKEAIEGTVVQYLGVLPSEGVIHTPMHVKETRPSTMRVGDDVTVLERSQKEMPLHNVHSYLQVGEDSTAFIPIRPEGGMVFLYLNPAKPEDWKADGYRWKNSGLKALPSKQPLLEKTYYQLLVLEGGAKIINRHFSKVTYRLLGDSEGLHGTLIHYLGTVPEEGVKYPHGNNKRDMQTYIRTAPSVLKYARQIEKYPTVCYSQMVSSADIPASHEEVLNPRNVSQIKNAQSRARKMKRLSQWELYSLVELSHRLDGYVQRYLLVPEVAVVLAHPCVLNILQSSISTISTHSTTISNPNLLSYDVSHDVGDFHITPLLFKHPFFTQSFTIPVAFLLHQHNTELCHEMLLDVISKAVPDLGKCMFLTDGGDDVVKAFKNKLPLTIHLRNWNGIQSEVRSWLRRNGASEIECRTVGQDLKDLLMTGSLREYSQQLEVYSAKWSQSFAEFFWLNIHQEMISLAGRWMLEPLGVFNGYNGVSGQHCIELEGLIKSFTDRGEVAIDSITLCLYHLQCNVLNQLQRSLAGVGKYTLLNEYRSLAIDAEKIELQETYELEEIVEKVVEKRNEEGFMRELTYRQLNRGTRAKRNKKRRDEVKLVKENVVRTFEPQELIQNNLQLSNNLKLANKIRLILLKKPSSNTLSISKPT